jgi:hypothetical protein
MKYENVKLPNRVSVKGNRISIFETTGSEMKFESLDGSVIVNEQLLRTVDCRAVDRHEDSHAESAAVGEGEQIIDLQFPDTGLRWEWRVRQIDQELEVSAKLVNQSSKVLHIDDWNLLHADLSAGSTVHLGENPGDVRFFGWHPWDMRVETLSGEDGHHDAHNLCHLYDPVSGVTFLCGFVTLDRMSCRHHLNYSSEKGIEEYRAECTFGRYALAPGAEITSETLRIGFYLDPYAALDRWAETVHGIYKPEFVDLPPVGWNGTWIDAFSEREEPWEVCALENARLVREHLRGFDVEYIWTSQYNLKDGLPGNWLNVEEKQIPSGLPEFFGQLKTLGFTPGMWMAPFWFYAEAKGVLEENSENLLRDDTGEPIHEPGEWEFDLYADPEGVPRLTKYYLDGSHPNTKEFVRKIFDYYREIGVRYYMLDFLAIKENGVLADRSPTHMEAARAILEVIREAAGHDTHLQTAVSSTPGFIGLINAARVGRDFGEGRPLFPPYNGWRNAIYVLHDLHFGNTRYLVQNAAASWFTHRCIYINDFNLLTIDKPVPLEHAKIAVTVFGLGGSPLMLGDDFRFIDAGRLRMIKLCLPRTKGMPVPVDLFDNVYPDDYCRMVKLPVETAWDSYFLVAVYNLDDGGYEAVLDFAKLGLDAEVPYRIYEFWGEEYHGTYREKFMCTVAPHSVALFRLSRAKDYPWLLSTDMHVQQGVVEIESLAWNRTDMTLSGSARRPAGETGDLFLLMPRQYRLINHEGCHLMKDARDMTVVIRKQLRFESDIVKFEFRFEPVGTRFVSRKGWLPYATVEEWLIYVAENKRDNDTRVFE